MLFFLSIAAARGHVVESYVDNAVGLLGKDGAGRKAMTNITLRPDIVFAGGDWPSEEEIAAIHHEAHDKCYIANSLKTEITVEPAIEPEG
jgi:organic hydroperoxide reductase OsmC/OhrA